MDRLITLVTMRWRVEWRALVGMRERAVGLALALPGMLVFGLVGAAFAYVTLRALSAHSPDLLLPVISILATGAGLFWALSPLLAGVAFSESHDMQPLLHFPVPLSILVVSSWLANLTQPMVLAQGPLLIGVAIAVSAERPGMFLPALAGVGLNFGFILAVAQLAGLTMQGLARNRRLQDMALVVGLGLSFLLSLAPLLLFFGGVGILGPVVRGMIGLDMFAFSPFAWGVRAAVHAGRGELSAGLSLAVATAVATGVVMGLSAGLIERIHRGAMSLASRAQTRQARTRMLFEGPVGTLVEKDLRSAWREPTLKASLLIGLLGPFIFLFFLWQIGPGGRSGSALLLLAMLMGLSSFGANAFGFERRGIALLFSFPLPRWKILVAKNLAGLVFRAPGLLTLFVAGLVMAPILFLLPAVAIASVTLLIAAAMDNFSSILFPVAAPAPGANPHAASSGARGLGAVAIGALLLVAALLVSSPFVFLVWLPLLLESSWLWFATLPLAVIGGLAAYGMLVAAAARLLERREPELLGRVLGEA